MRCALRPILLASGDLDIALAWLACSTELDFVVKRASRTTIVVHCVQAHRPTTRTQDMHTMTRRQRCSLLHSLAQCASQHRHLVLSLCGHILALSRWCGCMVGGVVSVCARAATLRSAAEVSTVLCRDERAQVRAYSASLRATRWRCTAGHYNRVSQWQLERCVVVKRGLRNFWSGRAAGSGSQKGPAGCGWV